MQSRPSIPTYPSARTVASLLRVIGLVYLALAALPLLLTFAGFRVEVIEGLALAVAALFAHAVGVDAERGNIHDSRHRHQLI